MSEGEFQTYGFLGGILDDSDPLTSLIVQASAPDQGEADGGPTQAELEQQRQIMLVQRQEIKKIIGAKPRRSRTNDKGVDLGGDPEKGARSGGIKTKTSFD